MAQPKARGAGVPPIFSTKLKGTIVQAGQVAKFEVELSSDSTKPVDVHWLKDGGKLMNGARIKLKQENNVYTLLISEPVLEDAGNYECVAKNNFGSAKCSAQFLVQSADKTTLSSDAAEKARPKFEEPLKALMIQKGQSAIFDCKISGKEPINVKWLKGDKVIESSNHLQIKREGNKNTLAISQVSAQDEGEYKCVVRNECGSAEMRAPLKVI